jgi:hypothetical protein
MFSMGSTASGARSLAKQERNLLPHHVTVNVDKTLRAAHMRFTDTNFPIRLRSHPSAEHEYSALYSHF